MVSMKTGDSAQKAVDHFKEWFEDNGWKIGTQSMTSADGGSFGAINGELADEGKTLNVVIIEQRDESQVTITYNEKKQ